MSVIVRIRRDFFGTMATDLLRPHAIAGERVAFVFARHATAGPDEQLLFPVEYVPVRDEDYIADDFVGARFGTAAIRGALQRSRTTGLSCLQTHLHDCFGPTDFSGVDRTTIDELAKAFRSVAPSVPHGGLVLSRDNARARIWLPGDSQPTRTRVTIVGFPLTLGPTSR